MKLSQTQIDVGKPLEGIGPLGLQGRDAGQAPSIFSNFISGIIGLMTVIAIIYFVFLLITGAYSLMSAGGDKAQLESARKRIFSGIVGFILVIAAIFIVDLVGKLIGIDNILNPAELLNQILPY